MTMQLGRYYYAENNGAGKDVLIAFIGEAERDYWCRKLGFRPLTRHAVRHRYMPSDVRASWSDWPVSSKEDTPGGKPDLTQEYLSELRVLNIEHRKLKRKRIALQRMLKARNCDVSLRTI